MVCQLKPSRRRCAHWLVFLATALLMTGPALVSQGTLGATDLIRMHSPYREALPRSPDAGNVLQTDQIEQIALVAKFWRSAKQGDLQLWEPNVGAGVPLFTGVHNRVLAPWFAVIPFVPEAMGTTVAILLALMVGQWSTFALCRRIGIGYWGAVLGAVAFVYSGPSMAMILRIHEVLLFPLVLYTLHGSVSERGQRRGGYLAVLALSTAFVWVSGFPAAALFVLYLAAAFALFLLAEETRRQRGWSRIRQILHLAAAPVAAVVAGTAMASVQLLPSIQFLRMSGSLERHFGPWHSAGTEQLATTVSSRVLGAYQDGSWWWPIDGYSNPYEASLTAGGVVLVLLAVLAVGLRRPAHHVYAERVLGCFLMPAGLVVAVATYLGGPTLWVLQHLPFMASNSFGRARFITSLAFAMCAGMALDAVTSRPHADAPRFSGMLRWSCGAVLVAIALGLHQVGNEAARLGQLWVFAMAVVVPVSAAAVVWGTRRHRRSIAGVAVLLCALELIWSSWGFVPTSEAEDFYPDPPAPARFADEVGKGGLYRFASRGLAVLPPHMAALLGWKDLRIAFPSWERYRELMEAADPEVFSRRRLRTIFTEQLDLESPVLDAAAVRYMVQPLSDAGYLLGEEVRLRVSEVAMPASFTFEVPPGGVRRIVVGLAEAEHGCDIGWYEAELGHHVARRLFREGGREIAFTFPDVGEPGDMVSVRVRSTHCPAHVGPDGGRITVFGPDTESEIRIVESSGWAVFERPDAMPRVSLAQEVVRIDDDKARLEYLAKRPSGGPVVVEGGFGDRPLQGGTVSFVEDGNDRVRLSVDSEGEGLLVLRDVFAPGWRVTVNGVPARVLFVDHAFRGVVVPDGTSHVTFSYFPPMLQRGIFGAVGGLLLALALWVTGGAVPSMPGSARRDHGT